MDERTSEILRRFAESWHQTETRYDELSKEHGFENIVPVLEFMTKIRQEGADKYFRAGTSMHTLILSRSVNFGLWPDQKYIKIEAITAHDFKVSLQDGERTYRQYRLDDLNDVRLSKLLNTLKHTLVD